MLSDMQVFNQYFMPAVIERYPQMINQFNAASGGCLRLEAAGFDGNFEQASFYKNMFSTGRRVNRYGANSDVNATPLSQGLHNIVKVAGGFGPVSYEPSQMTWLRKPTQEGVTLFAEQFSQYLLADQLNTVIASAVAAIGNNADATNDISATAGLSHAALNATDAKFGDHSDMLQCRIMSGMAKHLLIGENISNQGRLFTAGNVSVLDVSGKIAVVTDAPALYDGTDQANPLLKVLTLVPSGGVVRDGSDIITNIETSNGKQRIETTMQSDYSFGVGLKGYSWDDTISSPTDAQLATGANWTNVESSVKHTAGVLTICKAE